MSTELIEKENFKFSKSIKIKPASSWMSIDLSELWAYRELLYFLAWRDVKVRYKQTVLGVLWVLLQPMATTLVFSVLFSRLLVSNQTENIPYPLFAFSGFVLWTFVSNAITNTSNSLINQTNLITKVYFPRLVLPLAAVGGNLFDFTLNLLILVLVTSLFGTLFSWQIILAPFFLALLLALVLGVGILTAALNVRFRDVKQIMPFALQLWLFVSPVFYSFELLPEKWRWIWQLNPLTGILNGLRGSFFGAKLDLTAITISVFISFVLFLAALYVFRRMEDYFADFI